MKNFLAHITPKKIKIAVTIALAILTGFGLVQPEQATHIRNTVGMALELISDDNTGDLL